ncbi:MAG: VWA domain-containing protein [Magnetococcus sp. YQC-9]
MIEAFHWLRPEWLLALLGLIPLGWWLGRRAKWTHSDWHKVCDPHLMPRLFGSKGSHTPARHVAGRTWHLVILVAAVVILALAGPAWRKLPQPLYQKQSALVLLLDLSLSMDATDVAPSRLERAKLKITDLLKRRREGGTALIAYAGEPFVVAPLTTDVETIRAQLTALTSDIMPLLGSRPDLGIALAERLLVQSGVARGGVLLITDGDFPPESIEKARELTRSGRTLSVLAVGTAEGAPIRLKKGGFLQDAQGAIVIPRLAETPLQRLAQEGNGRYARLTIDDADLERLLAETLPDRFDPGLQREGGVGQADLWHEEGPWLLLGILPVVALGFRRGVLGVMMALAMLPHETYALDWETAWRRADQQALEQFQAGNPQSAAEGFADPAWRGAALYRAGRFEEASELFMRVESADGSYNRGNALARLERYAEALQAYDEALKRDPNHTDARYNRDLVQQQIEKSKAELLARVGRSVQKTGKWLPRKKSRRQLSNSRRENRPNPAPRSLHHRGATQPKQGYPPPTTSNSSQRTVILRNRSITNRPKRRLDKSVDRFNRPRRTISRMPSRRSARWPSTMRATPGPRSASRPMSSGSNAFRMIPAGCCARSFSININDKVKAVGRPIRGDPTQTLICYPGADRCRFLDPVGRPLGRVAFLFHRVAAPGSRHSGARLA